MNAYRPPELPEVLVLEPEVHTDARGSFAETFHRNRYRELGLDLPFVQDNLSCSRRGVLRGLHFQHPHAQGKLVQVVEGEVFDVAVDVRVGSPRFGRWFGTRLSDRTHRQLYVPPDFAHGFAVLSAGACLCYKCTDYYDPEAERTLAWDDPALAIQWPVREPRVSERDRAGRTLAELEAEGLLPVFD